MAFGPIMRFTVGELQIELAPITKEAVAEFVNHEHGGGLQNRSVTRYMGMWFAPVLDDETDWFERTRKNYDALTWGIWVVSGTKRTLIGNSAITDIGKDGETGFIRQGTTGSIIFRKDYWGKGIASAAHKARTWYAFKQLGLHRLKSAVVQGNGGSLKALNRSGYFHVYTERNEQFSNGALEHMDNLECLNPLDLFWSQWWHGDRPTKAAVSAKKLTLAALEWAEANVDLT